MTSSFQSILRTFLFERCFCRLFWSQLPFRKLNFMHPLTNASFHLDSHVLFYASSILRRGSVVIATSMYLKASQISVDRVH